MSSMILPSIIVMNEKEERFKNGFKPDEETMQIIFKYVWTVTPSSLEMTG